MDCFLSGIAVSVAARAGLRAISLPGLELMRRYRRHVRIPRDGDRRGRAPALAGRVRRQQGHDVLPAIGTRGWRPKDLLYLRNVAAAGAEVMDRLEEDPREMARDRRTAEAIRHAGDNLRLAVIGGCAGEVEQAVAALRERDAAPSDAAALAEFRGRLADLLDVLSPRRPATPRTRTSASGSRS